MASRVKTITVDQSPLLAVGRNTVVKSIALCAAAATSTLEVFEGLIGTIATAAIGAGGTGYTALDVLTLAQAGGGTQATVRVDTVDGSGVITAITVLTGGSGYVAASTYATTGGTGTSGTITASTVSDAGVSKGKISCVANTSKQICLDALLVEGVSVRITGASAKGYLYHE